jgi:SAM-dependent methyltransferase
MTSIQAQSERTVKYDALGIGYDGTRRPDPRIVDRLLALLRPPSRSDHFLDVACGTGNYTACLAAAGLSLTGVDQSETMLSAARKKFSEVDWRCADVEALPFADGVFAGVICTNAVNHFADIRASFREIGRVLSPNARFVIFTASRDQMRSYWLNAYFPVTLQRAIEQMPPTSLIEAVLAESGMHLVDAEPWKIPPDPVDMFLYAGKHQPELYLDPTVRAGISQFANLGDPEEVAAGIDRLRHDVKTGRIVRVMESYHLAAAGDGDYLFYVAQRNGQG